MIRHDKLVRDLIPALIERSGRTCRVRRLDDQEFAERLDEKLREELNEYLADGSLDELADLVEVIRAAAVAHGGSWDEVERLRLRKLAERGGFAERIFLMDVDGDDD